MAQRSSPSTQAKIMPRLSAPLSKLRKQWLNSVADLDPQAALAVLRDHLQGETDGAVRLGNMAAQSWIIRQRLIGLQAGLYGQPVVEVAEDAEPETVTATASEPPEATQALAPDNVDATAAPQGEGWTKLRILDETEVKGMRFFAGTTIQVHEEDARKLIEAKSAELVDAAEEAEPTRPARSTKKAAPKK